MEETETAVESEVTSPAPETTPEPESAPEAPIAERMAKAFGTEEEATTPEPETAPAEVKTEEDPAAEKPTPESAPAFTIPAAYRRSLKAYQWSDAEIDEAAKVNPESFLRMAEKVHASRVQETSRWAEIGKTARTAQPAPAAPAKENPFDVKKLREKYGNEPFIDAMEAMASQLDASRTFITQAQERQQKAELEHLTQQIDKYFGSDDLKPYADQYGKHGTTLTDTQLAARQKVLETADLLISGARSMGRPITLDEALTMAHDSLSAPIQAKAAVKKVEAAVRTRQQAITLRPGSRSAQAPQGRKDLEAQVASKLKAVFA